MTNLSLFSSIYKSETMRGTCGERFRQDCGVYFAQRATCSETDKLIWHVVPDACWLVGAQACAKSGCPETSVEMRLSLALAAEMRLSQGLA